MNKYSPLCGLILNGGRSSRMGHDKGSINYHGKPQREFLFGMMLPLCDTVYISCKRKEDVPIRLNPLEDSFEIESPLNGILSAFAVNSSCTWLSVPVDMPNIDQSVLLHLLEHRDTTKFATCFFDSDGKHPEPLLTVWEPHAWPALNAFYKKGAVSPRTFLMTHPIHVISVPAPQILININSPEELEKFNDGTAPRRA